MSYENAKIGIGRMFRAEMIELLCSIIAVVVAVVELVLGTAASSSSLNTVDKVSAIMLIVVILLTIFAVILSLTGVLRASKDEDCFKRAIYAILLGMVCSVLASVFESRNEFLTSVLNSAQRACLILETYYVLTGCANLCDKVKDEKSAKTARTALSMICISVIASVAVSVIASLLKTKVGVVFSAVLALVAIIIEIIAQILYLVALRKTTKAL